MEENKKSASSGVIIVLLLIIIAIIAIPVVNSSIQSSELSTMESDAAVVNLLVKEAINTYKADIKTTSFNGKPASEATVGDVLAENGMEDCELSRSIVGNQYSMVFDGDTILVSGGDKKISGTEISLNTTIVSLSEGRVANGSYGGSSKGTCGYKYSDGTICGAPCNKYSGLCDYHFNELDNTYHSLLGD